jgi:hypothetical protein
MLVRRELLCGDDGADAGFGELGSEDLADIDAS